MNSKARILCPCKFSAFHLYSLASQPPTLDLTPPQGKGLCLSSCPSGLRATSPFCLPGVGLVLAVSAKLYRTQGIRTPSYLGTMVPGTPKSAWNPHGPNMVHPLLVSQYLPSCSYVGTHLGPACLTLDLVGAQWCISRETFRTS